MGRVLLAGLDEAAIAAIHRDKAFASIAKRARADRARGHVLHLGEFEAGVASIAAPLRDAAGRVVAAINLSAPLAEAVEAHRRAAREAVLAAAATISRDLGFGS